MSQNRSNSKKPVVLTTPVMKVLAAAGTLLVFAVLIYLSSRMPAPKEQDRIWTSNGNFSIIKPHDWESKIVYAPPGGQVLAAIELRPGKSLDIVDQLTVVRFKTAPDLEKLRAGGYATGSFQGQEAHIMSNKRAAFYTWSAVFRRYSDWYQITLILRRPVDLPGSEWWDYLTSFQARPQPASVPAFPATLPGL